MRISIAPVKGLGLVHPREVALDTTGVLENRRFYIVDADGRRYGQLRNGRLVRVRPDFHARAGRLTLTFPDGTVASGVGVSDDRPGSRGAAWPKREAVPRRQPSIGVERTQSPALP